jgi:predicted porin
MKKSLIALAALAAVTAASAQSSVAITGSIGLTLSNVTEGLSTSARTNLSRSTGAIQVTGTEDLGGGMTAGFRLEEGVFGGATASGRVTTGTGWNTGNFGSRQSFLTLSSKDMGTIKLGRDLDANSQMIGVGNVSGANAWVGLDDNTNNAVFHGNHRANSASYTAPTMAGFTVGFGITPADYASLGTKISTTTTAAATGNVLCANDTASTAQAAGTCNATIIAATNPTATSYRQDNASALAITYANGPLNAGFVRTNYQTASNVIGTTFAANYNFGVVRVGGLYQTVEAVAKITRKASIVSANAPIGAWALQVAYGSSDGGATAGGGTKEVKHTLVGAQYNLSKRTSFYAISSDKKVDGATANDGDHKEIGFGIKHAF